MNTEKMIFKRIIPFWIIGLIVMVLPIFYSVIKIAAEMPYDTGLMLYVHGDDTLFALLPYFVVPMTYGLTYYNDKKNNFSAYIGLRISIKKYRKKLIIISALMAFLCIFIRDRILFYTAVSLMGNIIREGDIYSSGMPWESLLLSKPYIYSLIFSVWKGFSMMLYAIFSVILSFHVNNYLIIATGGLIYRYLSDLIADLSPFYNYISLIYAESLSGFGVHNMKGRISGFTLFIAFMIIVHIIGERREKREVV